MYMTMLNSNSIEAFSVRILASNHTVRIRVTVRVRVRVRLLFVFLLRLEGGETNVQAKV